MENNPPRMAGECLNPELDYAIKDHRILPMIVIYPCKVDFHIGSKASVPTRKILLYQHKVKNDLLFGCLCKNCYPQLAIVTTGFTKETDAANKTSF